MEEKIQIFWCAKWSDFEFTINEMKDQKGTEKFLNFLMDIFYMLLQGTGETCIFEPAHNQSEKGDSW